MVLGDYMRSVAARNTTWPPVRYIWAGDYNRHHSLWDEERNFHLFTQSNLDAAQPLLDLIARHRMKMALAEGIPTLKALATGNLMRVDNVFCLEALLDHVISCVTVPEDRPPKTDHFPIRSIIHAMVHRSKFKSWPKYREVDWESFRQMLQDKLAQIPKPEEIQSLETFYETLERLDRAIQDTIEQHVKMSKPCPYSKRWWCPELDEARSRV